MKRNRGNILFIIDFLAFIVLLGLVSFVNLVDFYVNDVEDYNEWTPDLGNKFETDEASNFYEKHWFINFNGAVRNMLGQHEMNGVVKLNNKYLITPMSYTADNVLEEYVGKVVELDRYLEQRGIALIYVTPPHAVSKYDSELPTGVNDYGNDNIDRFLSLLASENVDTMDFRELMYKDGIDQYSMMYRTDHHWTTRAGLYAYNKLEKWLVEKLNCETDERVRNIDNYDIITYENRHLGSKGRRTGIYYAGIDDFDLIIPKFDVTVRRGGYVGTIKGIYNVEALENEEFMYQYAYDQVLNIALGDYFNFDCKNDKKILIVTDSFGKAVAPYIAMGFREVQHIHEAYSEQLTKDYIDQYLPDAVILLYYPAYLSEASNAFNFVGFETAETQE